MPSINSINCIINCIKYEIFFTQIKTHSEDVAQKNLFLVEKSLSNINRGNTVGEQP